MSRLTAELHPVKRLPCSALTRDLETVEENIAGATAAGDFEFGRGARQMRVKLRAEIARRKAAGTWREDDGPPALDTDDTDVYRTRPAGVAA